MYEYESFFKKKRLFALCRWEWNVSFLTWRHVTDVYFKTTCFKVYLEKLKIELCICTSVNILRLGVCDLLSYCFSYPSILFLLFSQCPIELHVVIDVILLWLLVCSALFAWSISFCYLSAWRWGLWSRKWPRL